MSKALILMHIMIKKSEKNVNLNCASCYFRYCLNTSFMIGFGVFLGGRGENDIFLVKRCPLYHRIS